MHHPAVGGLADQVVAVRQSLGIPQDGPIAAPEITGEAESDLPAVLAEGEGDGCRPEDMARVPVLDLQLREGVDGHAVLHGLEAVHDSVHVCGVVEGLGGFVMWSAAPAPPLLRILLLDVGAVGEHVGAEVPGGVGGPDRPSESFTPEPGEESRVVDVGVGEEDRVHGSRVSGELPIQVLLGASALIEAAIQEDAPLSELQHVEGAGDGSGGAPEGELHDGHPRQRLESITSRMREGPAADVPDLCTPHPHACKSHHTESSGSAPPRDRCGPPSESPGPAIPIRRRGTAPGVVVQKS